MWIEDVDYVETKETDGAELERQKLFGDLDIDFALLAAEVTQELETNKRTEELIDAHAWYTSLAQDGTVLVNLYELKAEFEPKEGEYEFTPEEAQA